MSQKKSNALLALTASALAIPGLVRPAAAAEDNMQVDYRYSAYREGDLDADRSASNSKVGRYHVNTHQIHGNWELAPGSDISADVVVETMSGASPWYITPAAGTNKPVQVMSGASIEDSRQALTLGRKQRFGDGTLDLHGSYSNERDYRSGDGGLGWSYDFGENLNTVSIGASYTVNRLQPTDGGVVPGRIVSADSHAAGATLAYTRVLGADSQAQLGVSYTQEAGFLSDPYKLAYLQNMPGNPGTPGTVPDERPDGRREWAAQARLRQWLAPLNAALALDYRYYRDDWQISSHTVDVAYRQQLPGGWEIAPGVRWYSQSQSYFYAPYYAGVRSDNFASSDYRLSPYGALSWRLEASSGKLLGPVALRLRYENYRSKGSYAVGKVVEENPGLVDFSVISASIGAIF
ncbi:MAG TPA: DUF3570 domain-containing protein [Nevskiaceae bacterium]|nr:DUF3570 domain-containing protein [Nevskiaceae bacterium]